MPLGLLLLPLLGPVFVLGAVAVWRANKANGLRETLAARWRALSEAWTTWAWFQAGSAWAAVAVLVALGAVAWATRARWVPVVAKAAKAAGRLLWLLV